MALIVGNITGVGIFSLPTSLAFYGPITLVCMALTTVSPLALLFAATAVYMICAEMPVTAADDGLFPERFKRMSQNGVRVRRHRLHRAGIGCDDH